MELDKVIKVIPKSIGYYLLKEQATILLGILISSFQITTFLKYYYEDRHNTYIKMPALRWVTI